MRLEYLLGIVALGITLIMPVIGTFVAAYNLSVRTKNSPITKYVTQCNQYGGLESLSDTEDKITVKCKNGNMFLLVFDSESD